MKDVKVNIDVSDVIINPAEIALHIIPVNIRSGQGLHPGKRGRLICQSI